MKPNNVVVVKQNVLENIYKEGNDAELNITAHDILFKKFKKKYRKLLLIIVICTSISATFGIVNQTQENEYVKWVITIFSCLSFFLVQIQDYTGWQEKLVDYNNSSNDYLFLSRNIKKKLVNDLTEKQLLDLYSDIIDQRSIIDKYALEVPTSLYEDIIKNNQESDKCRDQNYTRYVFELSRSDDREKHNISSQKMSELTDINEENIELIIEKPVKKTVVENGPK